jgi:hypothetical protein
MQVFDWDGEDFLLTFFDNVTLITPPPAPPQGGEKGCLELYLQHFVLQIQLQTSDLCFV